MFKYKGYSNLVELNQPGVFALVHVRTKSMYISYSNNILKSVSEHLSHAKKGTHVNSNLNKQYKNLRLYIIEICDYSNCKYQCAYWYKYYKDQGYNLYNKRKPVQYRVAIEIDIRTYKVLVQLVNKRKERIVLGVFDKVQEAEQFALLVQSQEVIRPLYATNELTRLYVLEHS